MRLRIRIRKHITLERVLLFLALLFVSSYALLEHVSISIPVFSMVKFPLLYAGGICILSQANMIVNSLRKKKYFYVFLTLFIFCIFLLISAYINRKTFTGSSPVHATIRLVLFLVELFSLMVWISETGQSQYAIRFLYKYVFWIVVVTDFLLLSRLLVFRSGKFETYLVGTKFIVSYLHMDLLTLWFINNNGEFYFWQKSKIIALLAAVIIVAVSVHVDCMTGLIGCFVLVCLFALLNTPFQKKIVRLSSPVVLTSALAVSVFFPFLAEAIVSIPFVQFFLKTVLDRSNTLTGRTNIFYLFSDKMYGHWLWGFGFGNGNVAASRLFGYANAQNAILNWVLQSGLLATVTLIILIMIIFQQFSKTRDQMRIMPLAALIYVYIVMGTVETTFAMSFILWLALLFMQITEKKPIHGTE